MVPPFPDRVLRPCRISDPDLFTTDGRPASPPSLPNQSGDYKRNLQDLRMVGVGQGNVQWRIPLTVYCVRVGIPTREGGKKKARRGCLRAWWSGRFVFRFWEPVGFCASARAKAARLGVRL